MSMAVRGSVHSAIARRLLLVHVISAMLMLTVGMHLPLRDRRLDASLRGGLLLALLVGLLAVPAGLLAAAIAGGGHAAVYAVVLASGSAAVLLPAIEAGARGLWLEKAVACSMAEAASLRALAVFTNTTATSPLTKNIPSLKYVGYRLDMKHQGSRWLVTKMATISFTDLTPQL